MPSDRAGIPLRAPEPLGLARSFGFGDRMGLAWPGHIAAARRYSIAPVFAQLIPRDFGPAERSASDAITTIAAAAARTHFPRAWGADAHGIKTAADIEYMAAAGVTWFTLDPSAHIENRADTLDSAGLAEELAILGKEGVLPANWLPELAGRRFVLSSDVTLAPELETFARAGVKYARALQHAQRLARHVDAHSRHAPVDLELALMESAKPASAAEHLFIALESRRRGLRWTSLALRWDAGIDPRSEFVEQMTAFKARMRVHAAIARDFGPYKISVHHADDAFDLLPGLARACGDHLHIKTSATTFLAGLRLVCRAAPELFREIAAYARVRFESERNPGLFSTSTSDIDRLFRGPALMSLEAALLDTSHGRHMLDTTTGSILRRGMTSRGRPFREAITEVLQLRRDDHQALLDETFTRHLELLNAG